MSRNPLFNLLSGGQSALPQNTQNLLSAFQQFKNNFRGDPKQQIQQMLNSGKISQSQYNQAVRMANELYSKFNP